MGYWNGRLLQSTCCLQFVYSAKLSFYEEMRSKVVVIVEERGKAECKETFCALYMEQAIVDGCPNWLGI
jgi:hypothetical protein